MDDQGGYLAQEESSSKLFRYLAGVAAFIFIGVIGKPYIQSFFHPRWTAERVQAELEKNPAMAETFIALRENYPADARAFMEQAAVDANRDDIAGANRNAFLFMRRFMQSKAGAIVAAPADHLRRIAREFSAMLHVLKNDAPALCAQFVMDGYHPGDNPPPNAAEHMGRLTALEIRAAHAGESAGRVARGPVSDRDGVAFVAALRANDPSVAPLLGDQAALRAAPPDRQCALGVAIYDAAAELPEETSANIVAQILRDSLSQ
jgi:hypothetical protein